MTPPPGPRTAAESDEYAGKALYDALMEAWPTHTEGEGGTGDPPPGGWRSWEVRDPTLPSWWLVHQIGKALSSAGFVIREAEARAGLDVERLEHALRNASRAGGYPGWSRAIAAAYGAQREEGRLGPPFDCTCGDIFPDAATFHEHYVGVHVDVGEEGRLREALELLIAHHETQAWLIHKAKEKGFHEADRWEDCVSLMCANARQDIEQARAALREQGEEQHG